MAAKKVNHAQMADTRWQNPVHVACLMQGSQSLARQPPWAAPGCRLRRWPERSKPTACQCRSPKMSLDGRTGYTSKQSSIDSALQGKLSLRVCEGGDVARQTRGCSTYFGISSLMATEKGWGCDPNGFHCCHHTRAQVRQPSSITAPQRAQVTNRTFPSLPCLCSNEPCGHKYG